MEVPRVLAFQHGEVGHDLKPDSQDLLIPAQCVRSDGDLFTLLDEGDVHYCGHIGEAPLLGQSVHRRRSNGARPRKCQLQVVLQVRN